MTSKAVSGTRVDEIAEGIYRISTPTDVVPGGFTFNQFLIADEEPLLFHTGLRKLFPAIREAISRVIPVERLRYVALSHVEADESGALNEIFSAPPAAPRPAPGGARGGGDVCPGAASGALVRHPASPARVGMRLPGGGDNVDAP